MSRPKIIIFSLTRRGCIEYAESMISFLPEALVIASSSSNLKTENVKHNIRTYGNSLQFIFRSIGFVFSCYFFIKSLINENGKNLIFYFPVFHPWNFIILLYSKTFKIRTISTVHDFVQHVGEENLVTDWIQKQNLNITDKIIFLSQSELAKVPNEKLKLKTIVIPHPILTLVDEIPKRSYQSYPDVLFLGRISRYKGIGILLEAYHDYKNKIGKLTIAGEVLDNTIQIKNDQKIEFINGYLSEIKIKKLLCNHQILVLPYIDASQSGVLTLGIDSCIPMIISDLPGLREQLDDKCAYWVKPGSSEDILKAIEWYSVKENYEKIAQHLKDFKGKQNQEIREKLLQALYDSEAI